ncbi:MAG: AbgT family transporter [Weeksellaceae bacterium]|nr:AbgT family transporter [Weeksellaceae bacterium]
METTQKPKRSILTRILDFIEKNGNKLPDPAVLFFGLMVIIWVLSAIFANFSFAELDPRSNEAIEINNLLSATALANFLSNMVTTFTSFVPLGIVLVAMLGVGVAEYSGYINTGIKTMLSFTPKALLTPMLILVAIVSHTATDAGYVLVIPIGGIIFHSVGRHPLAGIAAAFAGVSGGFSANFIPSGIDPMLQGFTQSAAQIIDPTVVLNPLNNIFFTGISSILIVLLGWYITDKIVEPRLRKTNVELDAENVENTNFEESTPKEKRAFWLATAGMIVMLIGLFLWAYPAQSALRSPEGRLDDFQAPLMRSIVPIIFIVFLIPGVIYGYVSGVFKTTKDVVAGMTKAMNGMAYYIVLAFFCALFIDAFAKSNLGTLLAVKGANFLKEMNMPAELTIVGIIGLTAFVNLFIGSAGAKWGLLSPIFVPILMGLGISPDLTQAGYRVGDSVSNIITPLMPYFPLVVVYCQRYVKTTGIGTLVSMMLPYSIVFGIAWTIFLILYWKIGIPLGLQSTYEYVAPLIGQ